MQATADICDLDLDSVQVVTTPLTQYGGRAHCSGPVATFLLEEDNRVLKEALQTPGEGRVAVVQVSGGMCAVVGDKLAGFALENGWAGIVLHGYLRDTRVLKTMPIAVWALGTFPRRSTKRCEGKADIPLHFGDVSFEPGAFLYGDDDGIVLSKTPLDV